MNMGACMAPAAAHVIAQNIEDFSYTIGDYDQIITGDLGQVGRKILLDILLEKGYDIASRYMDCGIEIYGENQNVQSGGSGCGCSAVMLTGYILQKIQKGEWNRVLFVPTGALLSPVSFNEGKSVPGIAHGVILERASEK
jgi:stage V sporulation protein AD